PLGHTQRVEYDALGNVSALVDQLGQRTTFEHDAIGRLTGVVDPLGRRVSRSYDALNRVVSATDSSGAKVMFSYDINGNLSAITDHLNHHWTRTYDAKNRVVSITDPLLRPVRLKYNLGDELTEVISPSGHAIHYEYTPEGWPAAITDALGGVVRASYDSRGALVGLTDPRGHMTTFIYEQGRPLARRDPLGRLSSLNYDQVGNVVEKIDQNGGRMTVIYDALNRPVTVTYPDAIVSYDYDAASRPTRIEDSQSGFVAWTYDDAGRLSNETTDNGAVSYDYNAAGQPVSMTPAGLAPIVYGYDAAGRIQTITQGSDVFTYAYDQLSRVTSLHRPNGVTTTYSYDELSRLARLTHAGAQHIEDFRFTYGTDNQIETIDSLASATKLPPETDAAVADPANRVVRYGPRTYEFNPLGQTSATINSEGASTYRWDARGRLTQAILPDGKTVTYQHDALGRLAHRSADGETNSFLYNAANIVFEQSAGGRTVEYINGPGIDDILRQTSADTGSLYFAQDHLGSTVAITDASGDVVERAQYEPFGQTSGSSLTRYGFTGRELDDVTGLMYYRARWYDSVQGRFISEDPIGFSGGDVNLYAYVWQNPMDHTDPMGLDGWGNDTANWLEGRIGAFQQSLGSNPDAVYFNTGVNYAANIYYGVANLFRVGTGVGHALYDDCDNGYGRSAAVLEDVGRAAAIFELLGGPAAGVAGSGSVAATAAARAQGPLLDSARLLPAGNTVPNAGGSITSFVTTENQIFFRVFSGNNRVGGFLTDAIPTSSAAARQTLSLPSSNRATFVQEVLVPRGTRLQRSTALPAFGGTGGAQQFELLRQIPVGNFGSGVPLP
ncbi:MAG: RHS repeat-associated core domain-containing protein, partial [Pyrinomonadaceae bacterium]